MKNSQNITALSLISLSAIFLFTAGCGRKEKPKAEVARPAKILTIKEAKNLPVRTYPGRVRASKRANLAFQVSGQIKIFPVREGQKVKKGDMLAQLDQRDFSSDLDSKRATFNDAKSNFERYKKLLEKNAVSKADYEKAKRDYEVARSNVEIAMKALQDTTLKAPFDGMIANRYVENFENIQAKQEIISIQDISEIEVVVDVPEKIMIFKKDDAIKPRIEVKYDSIPDKKFDLKLKEYSTAADPETQTYQVVLVMPASKDFEILPGMTAKVTHFSELYGGKAWNLIPVEAVFTDENNKQCVWLLDSSSRANKHIVELAGMTGENIQVQKGLKPGDKIITAGVHFIHEGMLLKPLNETSGDK